MSSNVFEAGEYEREAAQCIFTLKLQTLNLKPQDAK